MKICRISDRTFRSGFLCFPFLAQNLAVHDYFVRERSVSRLKAETSYIEEWIRCGITVDVIYYLAFISSVTVYQMMIDSKSKKINKQTKTKPNGKCLMVAFED